AGGAGAVGQARHRLERLCCALGREQQPAQLLDRLVEAVVGRQLGHERWSERKASMATTAGSSVVGRSKATGPVREGTVAADAWFLQAGACGAIGARRRTI